MPGLRKSVQSAAGAPHCATGGEDVTNQFLLHFLVMPVTKVIICSDDDIPSLPVSPDNCSKGNSAKCSQMLTYDLNAERLTEQDICLRRSIHAHEPCHLAPAPVPPARCYTDPPGTVPGPTADPSAQAPTRVTDRNRGRSHRYRLRTPAR